MVYSQWNNAIAEHFFNTENAGRDIYLYVTKQDIINVGRPHFSNASENEIWQDFIDSITSEPKRDGLTLIQYSPIERPLQLFRQWDQVQTPPFISYLVSYIIPLTESDLGTYNSNNFYARVNDFFRGNGILNEHTESKIWTLNFRKISPLLWDTLEEWSIMTKNCELGIFELKKSGNKNWKHVRKVLSQCILPPAAINNLPELFFEAGMVPFSFYSDAEIKNSIVRFGASALHLNQNIINLVRKSETDDLGKSILEIVKREFVNWTGEEHEAVLNDGTEVSIRKNTIVPLKLQFKIDEEGVIDFSYRLKYSIEPPMQLTLDEFDNIYETTNWSRTLKRPFSDAFELRDNGNKWIAKFESRKIRLFTPGGYFQLSNDFWIETEGLSRVERMYLLCSDDVRDSIDEWGRQSCAEFRLQRSLANIPNGYSLFMLRNPQVSHETFQELHVNKEKRVLLTGGLKLFFRSFLKELLPRVEIENSIGGESVYLQYESDHEKHVLQNDPNLSSIWLLPGDIKTDSGFSINLENELAEGRKKTYKVIEATAKELRNEDLPKINRFNSNTTNEAEYVNGNNICISKLVNLTVDGQSFNAVENIVIDDERNELFKDCTLLKWLVGIRSCDIPKYNEAFEVIHHHSAPNEVLNIQQVRKSTLTLLDSLGYIDYNFESGRIYALPPKLIRIPSQKGKRVMLIGGRDETLVNNMIEYCSDQNVLISISIKEQSPSLNHLVPASIFFTSNSDAELLKLSEEFKIPFDEWYLLKLKTLLPTINEYQEQILKGPKSESWERFGLLRRDFDATTLQFKDSAQLSANYSFVEYTITSYRKEYGLWIDGLYHKIDKNWGKYIFLNGASEKVKGYGASYSNPHQIYVNGNTLFIPGSLPLPKLFSRLILQLNGEVPDFQQGNLNGKSAWYNVYRNVPSLFAANFFKFVLSMNIEKTNTML